MGFQIQRGRMKKPYNVVLIGVPGIGKTSWAVGYEDEDGVWHEGAENPIVLGPEENDEIQADRYPIPATYDELNQQLLDLIANPRGYKTVVLDTLDATEKLLHKKILAMDPKQTGAMASAFGGYAKAYDKAETELVYTRGLLKTLRDKHGMNLILIAHSKKAKATDTLLGLEYDTFEMALHAKAQALFVDWVSAVLFANYVARAKDGINSDKVFAMGQGERRIFTQKRPGHLAKNRYNLPFEMSLEFTDFKEAYDAFYAGRARPVAELVAEIEGQLLNLPEGSESTIEAVKKSVEAAKDDAAKLTKILSRVYELLGEKQAEQAT